MVVKALIFNPGVKCPAISAPVNGKMTGKTTFSFKDRLYFECLPGYDLVGSRMIECLSEGQWTAKPPNCKSRLSVNELSYA